MTRCTRCGVVVPPSEQMDGLAHCSRCDHVFDVASAASTASVGPIDLPPVPLSLAVDRIDQGVRVVRRWNTSGAWVHLWLLGVLLPPVLLGSLGLVPATVAALGWLAHWRNATTIDVRPEHLTVTHGPIPLPRPVCWSGSVSGADLDALDVRSTGALPTPGGSVALYALRAGDTPVLHEWTDEEALHFVVDLVHRMPPTDALRDARTPEGLTLRPHPEGVDLVLPWATTATRNGVHLLVPLALALWWTGGLFALLALLVLAVWFYLAQNRTTIRVRPDGIRIEHGPLPVPEALAPAGRFGRDTLASLRTTQLPWAGTWRAPLHTLVSNDGPLLQAWGGGARIRRVQEELERYAAASSAQTTPEVARVPPQAARTPEQR